MTEEQPEMSFSDSEKRLCEPGATAVNVNTGEMWVAVEPIIGSGYLIIRSPRDTESKVSREYWLGAAWADNRDGG